MARPLSIVEGMVVKTVSGLNRPRLESESLKELAERRPDASVAILAAECVLHTATVAM